MQKYDVIILGAGPSGYTLAAELATQKQKVAIVEEKNFGGTCVNYGCIPTKALLSAAKKFYGLSKLADFGISVNLDNIQFSWQKLQTIRQNLKTTLNNSINNLLKENQVDIYQNKAKVIDSCTVEVGDQWLKYDNLVLATGSYNRFLDLPNFKKAQTEGVLGDSDWLLYATSLPQDLVIIGGGPIAVEFAYLLHALGVKVTIIQDQPVIIPQFDQDIISLTTKLLTDLGIKIITNTQIIGLDDNYVLSYKDKNNQQTHTLKAQKYLLSVGRVINDASFRNLALQKDARGRLVLNAKMQTSQPNIYAVGDVTGQIQLTNVAYLHSVAVAKAILNQPFPPLNLNNIPYSLYLSPEMSSIGYSEQFLQQKQHNYDYLVAKLPAAKMPRNHAEQTQKEGFCKLIIDKKTHQILGAHLALTNSSLMINELALAMTKKLTVFDLLQTAHTHPTLSEAFFYICRNLSWNLR